MIYVIAFGIIGLMLGIFLGHCYADFFENYNTILMYTIGIILGLLAFSPAMLYPLFLKYI